LNHEISTDQQKQIIDYDYIIFDAFSCVQEMISCFFIILASLWFYTCNMWPLRENAANTTKRSLNRETSLPLFKRDKT